MSKLEAEMEIRRDAAFFQYNNGLLEIQIDGTENIRRTKKELK